MMKGMKQAHDKFHSQAKQMTLSELVEIKTPLI